MPIPPPLLRGSRREFMLEHILVSSPENMTMPKERMLLGLVLPPWQRPEVWTDAQKQRFIESLFLGLGAGYYVVNGRDWNHDGSSLPMSGWLIDGQQRISAIRDFVERGLVVFGDVTFAGLSHGERLRFLRTPFPCLELEYTDNELALVELYNRLNFGGTAHTEDQRAKTG